jgi:hypothetical protein
MLPLQRFRAVRICRLTCEGDAMRDDDVSVLPRPQREARVSHPRTGGKPDPWHRIAHCADVDLPWRLRERRRDGSLSYELVEASEPRVIKGPPLAMS